MARKSRELSDQEWALLAPFMPEQKGPGHPWKDHRPIVEGIFWILRTGAPWRDLPEKHGPWQTVYDRYVRWRKDGTREQILSCLQTQADLNGNIDWSLFCIDGSHIRASRAAAGGRGQTEPDEPLDHSLGRSRGGFGSKIHLVCDGKGNPISLWVTAGQVHDSTQFERTFNEVNICRPKGRPRKRPDVIAADKAYSAQRIRAWLRNHNIKGVIPERSDQKKRRASKPGRPLNFDKELYRSRNVVERLFGWLKECRRLATRYEKLTVNFIEMVKLAFIRRYLRLLA